MPEARRETAVAVQEGAESGATAVLKAMMALPDLSRPLEGLRPMDRFVDVDCLVGTFASGVHISIRSGRIVDIEPGPRLMKPWRFAYRATAEAWHEHWQELPTPGFHDLLAMTKRGVATVEGDLHPFLANLQYFKDLLALPRAVRQGMAA